MKTRNILLILFALLGICSCEDMFEPAKENTRQEDAFVEESKYAHGLLIYAYDRLPYITTSQTDVATDDAVTNVKNSAYLNMATGTWAADNQNNPMNVWEACRDGVQYANKFLTLVADTKWTPSSQEKQKMFVDRLRGEAIGLRAIFYYHLLQAHAGYADDGKLYGVPILTEPEDASSDFNQPRASFADCIKQIFADCDTASTLLPDDYADISDASLLPQKYAKGSVDNYNSVFGQKARNLVSRKVVEAIKGQAALLASSPAYREQSGVSSAEAADILAKVIMKQGARSESGEHGISRFDMQGNIWYKNKTKIESPSSLFDEILWCQDRHKDANQERENFPPTLYGSGRINPSQNLVDAYPMRNGLPITDPNSGYDAKNPYANRDPRLTNDILYNGRTFRNANIITGTYPNDKNETDDNIGKIAASTRTGYYLAKLLREDVSPLSSSLMEQQHLYARIRYTEIYLAFAEAANEAWGPKGDPNGYGFSAYSVIELIRKRAGIATNDIGQPLPQGDVYLQKFENDKDGMRTLIQNERRIELCFENKRFWDLRRWLLPLNEPVMGMRIDRNDDTGELSYTSIKVEDRKYSDYQYYGPIPRAEVLKWSNLQQNKGWK